MVNFSRNFSYEFLPTKAGVQNKYHEK